jgi:hypothetical protein
MTGENRAVDFGSRRAQCGDVQAAIGWRYSIVTGAGGVESRRFLGFVKKVRAADFFFWTVLIDSPKTRPTRRGRTKRTATTGCGRRSADRSESEKLQ